MFKKLIKYDFSYIAKIWWIAAVGAIGASVLGVISVSILNSTPDIHPLLAMILGFWLMLSIFTVSAAAIATQILICIRYYKHFFSDEGYLTFTLPVKRSTLLLSKTVNAVIWTALSGILVAVCITVFVFPLGGKELLAELHSVFKELPEVITFEGVIWTIVFVIEGILIMLASTWFGVSLTHFCITVGATITRKHKVLAAIGIYYAVNAAIGLISQVLAFIGTFQLAGLIAALSEMPLTLALLIVALVVLVVIAVIAGIALAFHIMTLNRIKNNLNMA